MPVVVERDQETIKNSIEIGDKQDTISGIEPLFVGRITPWPHMRGSQNFCLIAPRNSASTPPTEHDVVPKLLLTQSSINEPLSRRLVNPTIISDFIDIMYRLREVISVINEICLVISELKNACVTIF